MHVATRMLQRCSTSAAADEHCVASACPVVTLEPHEGMSSSARLYEVGRCPPRDDDSDIEDDNCDGPDDEVRTLSC